MKEDLLWIGSPPKEICPDCGGDLQAVVLPQVATGKLKVLLEVCTSCDWEAEYFTKDDGNDGAA